MIDYSDLIFAMLEYNISIECYDKIAYVRRGKVELSTQTGKAADVLALVNKILGHIDIENYLERIA